MPLDRVRPAAVQGFQFGVWEIETFVRDVMADPDTWRMLVGRHATDAQIRAAIQAWQILPHPLNRDSPDGLRPTTAVDLSDDSITGREINKYFFCSTAGSPGRFRAMMPPQAAFVEAFIVDPRRPSPSPPPSPAVSPGTVVIPAPSRALATVGCDPGSPGSGGLGLEIYGHQLPNV